MYMNIFKAAIAIGLLISLSTGCSPKVRELRPDSEPSEFGKAWVEMLRKGEYDRAWALTDEDFKKMTKRALWEETVKQSWESRGVLKESVVFSSVSTTRINGYPMTGQFVSVDVDTTTEAGDIWTDGVVLIKRNSQWKVLGFTFYKKQDATQQGGPGYPPQGVGSPDP